MRLAQDRWPSAFLGELCHIKIGKTPDRSNSEYWGSGHPWLSITDMQQGKDLVTTKETITQRAVDECRCYKVQPGTLLMSFKLSIGKLGFARIPMYTNEAIAALQLKDQKRISSDYLYYALQAVNLTASVDRAVKGMTLNTDKLNVLSIPLPSLPEQKRIAAILEKADRLRQLRRYALELSGTYLQSVFLEMFGDPTTNPKCWDLSVLSEEGILDRGKSQHRPRDAAHLYGGPYPFMQTGDVANSNGLITRYSQTYSEAGLAQSRLWKKGTLCITIAANIAKTAVLDFDACFPDSIVGFIPGSKVTTEYVRQWFVSIQSRLEKDAPQAAQKNINLEILRNLQIPIPPLQLQQKFAQIVQKYGRLRLQQREAERQAEHLFQTLLHKAFQGALSLDEDEVLMADVEIAHQQKPIFADEVEQINTGDAFQLVLPME